MSMCPAARNRARRALARLVIAQGGNLSRFAQLLGLSAPGALKWLRAHAPDLHGGLIDGRGRQSLPTAQVIDRLLALKIHEDDSLTAAAAAVGCELSALFEFRRRWAPDGVDNALADLLPEFAEAA